MTQDMTERILSEKEIENEIAQGNNLSVLSMMACCRHTLGILLEQLRSSLGAGKSMARVWLVLLLLILGTTNTLAQTDYSGTYYIGSREWAEANTTTNFYLCATEGWIYYDASATYSYTESNNGQPFMTTYQCRNGANEYDADKAVWIIEKHATQDYYYIKHAVDGKYLTANAKLKSGNANRLRLHLETTTSPNDNMLFRITQPSGDGHYLIDPKAFSGWYFCINQGNVNSLQGSTTAQAGQSPKTDGPSGHTDDCNGVWGLYNKDFATNSNMWLYLEPVPVNPPTFTPNADGTVGISTTTANTTIYYTTDGSDPRTSGTKTTYSSAISASDIAAATGSAIKVVAIDNDDNTKVSMVVTIPLATYTYKIVKANHTSGIAVSSSAIKQVVGKSLSGYSSIPEAIRSPYISDETITFYTMDGDFNANNLDDEHKISATPSDNTNIYVAYSTDKLGEKFLHLQGARPFNLKNSSSQYFVNSSGTTLTYDETNTETTPNVQNKNKDHIWYISGRDPYAVTITCSETNNYLTSSSVQSTPNTFILKSEAGTTVTFQDASGSIAVTINEVTIPTSYYLIDKTGKKLLGPAASTSSSITIPSEWYSPLAEYHYWKSSSFEETNGVYTLKNAQTELSGLENLGTGEHIYITYDVKNDIDLDGRNLLNDQNKKEGTTYMMQFSGGTSFNQEDGLDGVMTETRKAVYPYSNGDATLYVYGNERWEEQLASGASTRTRWLWYLEPASGVLDPYHVRVSSYQTQTSYKIDDNNTRNFHSYLRTYKPDGYNAVVTGVTNNNPLAHGGQKADAAVTNLPAGSEYMLLGTSLENLKLVTVDAISDGTTTERRTVNSFEQYWKNNPTVQGKLTTKVETPGRDVMLTDTQKGQLPTGWHAYEAWANSQPWVNNGDGSAGKAPTTSKKFDKQEHVFQTIMMGESFQLVPTEIKPMLILLDQHGWEIVRLPLPSGPDDPNRAARYADLHKYSSPMVARYHFWKTGSKIPGYHKFKVSDYATKSATDDTEYTADELGRADLAHSTPNLPDYASQAKVDGKERDWYVTYDVKPEYASTYAGAATKEATSAAPFLVKQGGSYAQISGNNSLTSTNVEPSIENVSETMQWYLRPNFDIDEEMGYIYAGHPEAEEEAKSKEDTEADYYAAGKNGFDPYNVQIQSVSNTARYFTANTTGSAVTSAWTGTSSSISLQNMGTKQNVVGLDQVNMKITNATFMVVDDGNGNMRLMPRFDHTKVMQTFTTLATQAAAAAANDEGAGSQSLYLTIVPKVVHSSSEITAMGGYYMLGSDFTASGSIGTKASPFKGIIEGQIEYSFSVSDPFIAYAEDAVIKNVIIESTSSSSSNADGHAGAIVATASGNTRIYNCGVNGGTISGTNHVGGIVGHLEDNARVINCYSYANVEGGSDKGGIVGYNNVATTAAMIGEGNGTMVMNCMFYGDISSGGNVAPIYGGENINNQPGGLNTYNYYAYEKLTTGTINKYNCALAMEERYLNRFEFYRQLLNSNRRLAAFYASTSTAPATDKDMMKWVLETADRSIAEPKPYPVLKAQGKYPSIINYDTRDLASYSEENRNQGLKTGTLAVTISGVGSNAPDGATITNGSLTLVRTDKDFEHFNFNYDKVQLPYYNDVGTKNYTGNKVVTGWKITGFTGGTAGTYTAADQWNGYNFADRNCTNKDKFDVSGRVFSQGAYFDVPYGVTGITIEPYWANAVYVADEYQDVTYSTQYAAQSVSQLGKTFSTGKITIDGSEQTVYTSISNALNSISSPGSTVYDNAVVLVGNYHQNVIRNTAPFNGNTSFTLMSVDLDKDNEPDYSLIFNDNDRSAVCPIRFDFLNIPGTAQAQKPNNATLLRNAAVFNAKGWFEITNTCLIYFSQFEYENSGKTAGKSPIILLGGVFDQFTSTKVSQVQNTTYLHVGCNAWFKEFSNGTHSDGSKSTRHIPISVTGGEYSGFYLTGTYNADAAVINDNAECYISGGHFEELAGAGQEQIGGNVQWQIYDADIDNFFGGGINENKPILGTITTDIYNSHVSIFCGGPKFGNMQTGKTVTTKATGCTFDKFFGAGYGGNSVSRKKYFDSNTGINWTTLQNYYATGDKGKYYDGETTRADADGKHPDYGQKGKGVATDFDYEFFVWTSGATGARLFVKFTTFSLAQCNDVSSTLTGCTINNSFYGGGSLGNVTGTATSVLDGCTVNGNVFGGGYSATLPTIKVRNGGFTKNPNFNSESGMFEHGTFSGTTDYEWTEVDNYPANGADGTPDDNKVITTVDLDALGQVGATVLTIKGNTKVSGIVEGETTGGVFGGGDMSAIKGNTQVNVEATHGEGVVNVYGGGNTADVDGNTEVNMTGGTVSHDVYGGGKGQTTTVGGSTTVNIGAKSGEGTLSGSGTVTDNVYGGSALGTVNAAAVNIYSGTVNGSVFGGGLGHDDEDDTKDIAAQNLGDATVTVEGGTVKTAVYGGSNENGVLKQKSTVTITGGTVGTLPQGNNPITNVVFGGGKGQPTLVNGDVTVNIGTKTGEVYAGTATINGHVYGGSALGNTNEDWVTDTSTEPATTTLQPVANTKTDVNLYAGTINGDVYGGGLGQKTGVNGATSDILSYVGGDVNVLLDGAKVHQVFGCNNLNGTPKGHVKVDVKRTNNFSNNDYKNNSETALSERTTYDVEAVYGGGNQADYNPTDANIALPDKNAEDYEEKLAKLNAAFAEVLIEGCDATSIQYVYGGGNAAAVPATQITINSAYIINQVFGGGNGAGENNPGANVGIINSDAYDADESNPKTAGTYGTGKAVTKLKGGQVYVLYGGSNTLGNVRGGTSLERNENNPDCTLKIGEIYGAGQVAPMDGDVNIVLECMPDDYVPQVFGGAKNATINGNVSLTVTSGKFGRVFGGNNEGGSINGSITVNVYEDGCQPLIIGELYGGGYNAPYSIWGCNDNDGTWKPNTPEGDPHVAANADAVSVNVYSCTSIGKVFGGGYGATADVVGNTHVWINTMQGIVGGNKQEYPLASGVYIGKIGQVFGGGNAASVKGDVTIDIGTATVNNNNTEVEEEKVGVRIIGGDDYLNAESNTNTLITAGIYGGGYSADVDGNVTLNIGTVSQNQGINITGNIFGGGYGETTTVTGDVTVNIGKRTNTAQEGNPVYAYEGYANITGDVYGGSAKGKVNATKGTDPAFSATADKATTVNLYGGTITGNLYGGGLGEETHAADVYGPVTVNVEGGKVTNVFGCNNVLGSPKSTATVNIHGMTAPVEPETFTITNVYGGGNQAAYNGTGGVSVAMTNGWVNDVFGGGLGSTATVNGTTNVTLTGGTVTNDVYGGGSQGSVTGAVNVTLNGSTVAQNIYGGGLGDLASLGEGHTNVAANINGAVTVSVISGTATNVFGCNNVNGMPTSTVDVVIGTKTGAEAPYTYGGTATISGNVYGGGNMAACTGNPTVKLYGGTVNTNVYGGGLGATAVTGGASVIMEGGLVKNDVFGGGSLADVTGSVSVVIAGGTVTNDVYGGGALANTNTANWDETRLATTYEKITATLSTGTSVVAGLYKKDGNNYILQGSDAKAEGEAEYYRRFDTAWAEDKTSASNTTTVILTGGTIGNVYGGGLGNDETPVYVYGDVSVRLNNATDRNTYGGTGASFTREIAQNVEVNGKNYPTIPTTGKIFGANNFNGSPKGDVTVEIWATKRVDGKTHVLGEYEVHGVYGGGNLANYLPASGKGTKVIIHGCDDTSIEYVYGGGNSASVPSTDVTIYGSFDIGYAFGGGNGSKPVKNSAGTWVANGGAMVTGNAKISARGGRIGQVFGGSDAKGDILGNSNADIETTTGQECKLILTRLFGAGNEADVAGDVNLILSGCASDNVQYVHGGSYNAHITGDVNLTITSGFYTNVFGGNDARGSIGGKINVNIEETDACKPIVIHNLVGGGNEAPYPGTKRNGDEYPDDHFGKVTVNIKSATRIDNVYGGGYKANVKGDAEVNINMLKGSMAGTELTRPDTYTGDAIPNVHTSEDKTYINDAIGTIGNVYGGGNEGNVLGSTVVNIGTATTTKILKRNNEGTLVDADGNPVKDEKGNVIEGRTVAYDNKDVLGAHITGDVFGGGNLAYVTGNTYVNINALMAPVLDNESKPTGEYTYSKVDYSGVSGFEGISISNGSIYGGGNQSDVHGNTNVRMSGGYVFNGIFGGGYSGSVGTFTTSTAEADVNVYGHTAHAGCIGKPKTCAANTGKCTVVVNGDAQIGPVEVATEGMPNPHGWVWGGGCGLIEDPADDPDTHFKTYVGSTDVTIGGNAFIMEGIIGGGEFGRVLGNTLVKIQDHCQIGVGANQTETVGGVLKPKAYTSEQWTAAATAVTSGNNIDAAALPECSHNVFGREVGGKKVYDIYDPYADEYPNLYPGGSTNHASNGGTWIGIVCGGGSGYMPYKKTGGYDWCRSAGWVEGNTEVQITGGHVLTNVYGGNEYTDVKGTSTVTMSGGTIGVPRAKAQIEANPLTGYLFGAGKGDPRDHFNSYTNVGNTIVNVSGGIIYGSVVGGSEDGHVLGNTSVTISGGTIGTWGTTNYDGNVFGGGRGFSGENLIAGSVGGNASLSISGGTIKGSVYGGGRLASVGINSSTPINDNSYGQLVDDGGGKTYGHITMEITGGTIGTTTDAGHTHSGNVYGGSMGRIEKLDGTTINDLWPKLAVAKTTSVSISGTADIKNNVYGGGEIGIVRNQATVSVSGGTVNGSVFGSGYGSDDYTTKTTITPAGYEGTYYTFIPMLWAGCASGNTNVTISGGSVKKNVYGGGELASVGLINFVSDADGNFTGMTKHESHSDDSKETYYGFGLSWPYKFQYIFADPKDETKNGKATVNITGGTIGTKTEGVFTENTGYVFGGSKGKVWFGANDNTEQDITTQRYTEAFCANVRETDVTIGGGTMRTVYGGGDDGHVYEDAKVTINSGSTIDRSVFGGGKGTSTFRAKLWDTSTNAQKADAEDVHSWTAGKVYGNTSITMNDGNIGWFVYGGGNLASVGKGNYSGGHDDYSTGGYGELPSADGAIWTATPAEGTYAHYFQNSGKTTVTILGGTIGATDAGLENGIPKGSVFGGSRGTAAKTITQSPRYKYGPDFFLGYVNKATINIGGTSSSAPSSNTPNIYGCVYGGGQDGHVRNSTEVNIFKGNIKKQTGVAADRSGNVFGAGSGIGTYTDGNNQYCNNASGSVTCTTQVDVYTNAVIEGNVYGGGAMASVGPPKIGQPKNEQKEASSDHASYSHNKVNIKGGSISGSVYGASRGPGGVMFTGENHPFTGIGTGDGQYNPAAYATSLWTEVNIEGGIIANNVYGGGEMGQVKESTVVNLTGGTITHDAYGGGKGTTGDNAIAANIGGNTTVELNKNVAESAKGCIVDKVFGCNDMNGTPKGHVTVHVYATQNSGQDDISHKVAPPEYTANRGTKGYKEYLSNLITEAKQSGGLSANATEITTAETLLNNTLSGVDEAHLTDAQKTDITTAATNIIAALKNIYRYDVAAVYGGGNLAPYEPYGPAKNDTDADNKLTTENTEVIIEGCGTTSIKQVYGGGNAASVPATDVLVKSCAIIDELFGGGNGKDSYQYTDNKWYENPGANVGYKNYTHHNKNAEGKDGSEEAKAYPAVDDATTPEAREAYKYGKGVANTLVNGGHIHTVYGGSNMKGNISNNIEMQLLQAGTCTLVTDEAYASSKSAETDAQSNLVLDCVKEGGTIYGGSYNADLNSDVNILITNGHYEKIFGGNNQAGTINGKITITIAESGCTPITIDELYGGGYLAPYSIYGYKAETRLAKDKDGNDIADVNQRIPYKPGEAGALATPYWNPRINIISATRIGKIFGGGYGAGATMIGSPHINVNMEKGMILKDKKNEYPDTYSSTTEDATGNIILPIGTIGDIYGGGELADVIGNTSVEIGTGRWISSWDENGNAVWGTSNASGEKFTYKLKTAATYYTQEECNEYNATITGALNSTNALTAEQAAAYNAAIKPQTNKVAGNTLSAEEANAYNATLVGARNTNDAKTPAVWGWYNADDEESAAPTTFGRNAAAITGNIFGGGKGETKESGDGAFKCASAMVGADGDGLIDANGGTSVTIANGSVGGSVYGGGELGRVEKNTVVTIGIPGNTTNEITIAGNVFGAGKGVATHGYAALVRGNSTVTIQGKTKVGGSVYGGGEIASVGRYNVDANGLPQSLANEKSGNCTVIVRDDAEIGPDDMTMTKEGGPDNSGHVFGAGQGAMPYIGVDGKAWGGNPWRIKPDDTKETFSSAQEDQYLKFIETLGLATQTNVTIGGNAFVKGDVFGGAEQGFVQHDTHVTIEGNCQIGNGYVQMDDDGTYLGSPLSVNRRYSEAEWTAGHLITVDSDPTDLKTLANTYYTSSLPECASWKYGQAANAADKYAAHDIYAGTANYDSKGGRTTADNGHTFYGNVFGGGSGYFPYAAGKWHWKAGNVGGNTLVEIKGGHVLTNVYGGNEMTNVDGKATVTMTGGTIGVPRTLGQIAAHPVTCYLFGGGAGDPRVLFNKQTNVQDAEVSITGGWVYGSVFGGGEDGHVMRNVNLTIGGTAKIGTWGTSYVDGNIFGGGRGFSADAYTAGNVAGAVTMNITGGEILGSVYGGGRLGSVGYGLYAANEAGYGLIREDHKMDDSTDDDGFFTKGRGHVDITISGGTIGNTNEFIIPNTTDNVAAGITENKAVASWDATDWTKWKKYKNVPNTEYDSSNGRVTHTKGGNVYAGGMGRREQLDGVTEITAVDWRKLGNVKSTKLTISGANTWIMGNVYGGGEVGAVQGYHNQLDDSGNPIKDSKNKNLVTGTEIVIKDGATIGTEVTETTPIKTTVAEAGVVKYTYGSVYGGGMGTMLHYQETKEHAGEVKDSTKVTISGAATSVRASVFGGGEIAEVSGNTNVTINNGKIGRDEVRPANDANPGYVMFGGATMGNVFGGGKGLLDHTNAGLVKGNTSVTVKDGYIYHNVYGGGALASVGTFTTSTGTDNEAYVPAGVPLHWSSGGTATVTINGGTIGISGRDNGMVNGSSRGDIEKPNPTDRYDKLAWVKDSYVTIGEATGNSAGPHIKGSVYGGGENGHNGGNATVTVNRGTIGIVNTTDQWYSFIPEGMTENDNDYASYAAMDKKALITRGNVYGAGCGTDTYTDTSDDNKEKHNPKSGMVAGNTFVNIAGGHIGHSVYGGGSMGAVGTITSEEKHESENNGFDLSWPYKFVFAEGTGKATVNITGGHIGNNNQDGGDVFGSTRGEAGDRYTTSHLAYVKETEVNVNYSEQDMTTAENAIATMESDVSIPCITGSVHGSGEDGYVYGDTHVTLNKGLIGHSLYGAGKGKGTYQVTLNKIAGGGTYTSNIYSLIAGKVFGNTSVTMNGGIVGRNVYGGGNMASVGKGNYAGGADDYYPAGYGETLTGNLWTSTSNGDNAWEFLNSGKTTVNVFGGKVGIITTAVKNNMPYGNVFGGSAGEAAPDIPAGLEPRYEYCPAFYSGYVNETNVTIGGYKCMTAYDTYKVGDCITAKQFESVSEDNASKWEQVGPTIAASVYGGGQDGHVRRDTKVTVNSGVIGLAYDTANQGKLGTTNLDDPQWMHRGNVYGGGSGISEYEFDFDNNGTISGSVNIGGTDYPEKSYSSSAGSVTRFTEVNILGGTIHRNVYGGCSMGSVGAPKINQDYDLYKPGQANIDGKPENSLGRQSMNIVTIGGGKGVATIGSPTGYNIVYGGEVYGACRGSSELDPDAFATSVWTQIKVKNGANIQGNVYGGGDAGKVIKDTDVQIGAQ